MNSPSTVMRTESVGVDNSSKTPAPVSAGAVRARLDRATKRFLLLVVVVSRLWNTMFMAVGSAGATFRALDDGGPGIGPTWFRPATFFDARWYLEISGRQGYSARTSVFYPLYPTLLRIAGSNDMRRAVFGVALSTLCFAVALPILYRLVALDHPERVARIAVLIVAFFPFSAVFGSVYTESLALLLLVSTWYLARTDRWGLAAVCGVLCGLTRNIGVVLGVALALELVQR